MSEITEVINYETVRYEVLDSSIARIVLNRPEQRNAQNRQMTYDLNAGFTKAAFDDDVKVIVLAGEGPHFSSGHDMKDRGDFDMNPIGISGGMARPGTEGHMAFEEEVYLNMCRRWQNLPKPTIAQVQGKTVALVEDPRALSEDCRRADIVVSAVPVRRRCASARVVVDRFDLWRNGAHAIRIGPDGAVSVETVADYSGNRLWTPDRLDWRRKGPDQ